MKEKKFTRVKNMVVISNRIKNNNFKCTHGAEKTKKEEENETRMNALYQWDMKIWTRKKSSKL